MAGAMGWFEYISDNGTTYSAKLDATNAALTGGVATTKDGHTRLPSNIKPRYVLATNPVTLKERKIKICDPADGTYTGATTTLSLPDFDATPSTARTFTLGVRVGEKRYG